MLNITLNLIGIVLITYSIYVIRKDFSRKVNVTTNHESNNNEEILSVFNELVEFKLEKIKEEDNSELKNEAKGQAKHREIEDLNKNSIRKKPLEPKAPKTMLDPTHGKIIELLEIGLTKEEIAKKLNKGIREIEIIIKLHRK